MQIHCYQRHQLPSDQLQRQQASLRQHLRPSVPNLPNHHCRDLPSLRPSLLLQGFPLHHHRLHLCANSHLQRGYRYPDQRPCLQHWFRLPNQERYVSVQHLCSAIFNSNKYTAPSPLPSQPNTLELPPTYRAQWPSLPPPLVSPLSSYKSVASLLDSLRLLRRLQIPSGHELWPRI